MRDDQKNDLDVLIDHTKGSGKTLVALAFGIEKFDTLKGLEGAAPESLKRLEAQIRSQLDRYGYLTEGRDGKLIAAILVSNEQSKEVALQFAEEVLGSFQANAICRTPDNRYVILSEMGAEAQGATRLQNITAIAGISFYTPASNDGPEKVARETGNVFGRAITGLNAIANLKHTHLGKRDVLTRVEVSSLISGIHVIWPEANSLALPSSDYIEAKGITERLVKPHTPPAPGSQALIVARKLGAG